MQIRANKKPSLYRDSDATLLDQLSKAALLDLLVEALRRETGSCDSPVDAETLRGIVEPTLAARGDRSPFRK